MSVLTSHAPSRALPEVHLEVRHGSGRSVNYTLDHVDFLIGAVPGCDWRVPATDSPPVLCLIARRPEGVLLRKLAPTQILLVNGQTVSSAELADGDRISVGAADIFVRIQEAEPLAEDSAAEVSPALTKSREDLQKQVQTFRAQVVRFQEERDAVNQDHERREQELREWQERLEAQAAPAPKTHAAVDPEIDEQRQELAKQQQDLAELRRQLHDRYQERRDRLAGLQEAVNVAARKVQEQKRRLDADSKDFGQRLADLTQRETAVEAEAARVAEQQRVFEESQAEVQNDLLAKLADLQEREESQAVTKTELEAKLKQYEADILRLDRRQGEVERREVEVHGKLASLEEKLAQLQHDGAEMETQATQLDAWRAQLEEDTQKFTQAKAEYETTAAQLAQRAALMEGQQATLAALRTRLERMREDVRRQEQHLDEQRASQESVAVELEQQTQALLNLKTELDNEQKLRDQERQQLTERGAVLEAAVAQLNQARNQFLAEETQLRQRNEEFKQREAKLTESEAILQGRLQQLAETQDRLDAERQTLRERTVALTEAEDARSALQEQLRKRSEELLARQRTLDEQIQTYQAKADALGEERGKLDQIHQDAMKQVETRREELRTQVESIERDRFALSEQMTKQQEHAAQLQEMGRAVAQQQEALARQQEENQEAWRQKQEADAKAKVEFDALRLDARRLVQLLPDAELRAGAILDRASLARDQLRDHAAEIHTFVRQCQDELETLATGLHDDVAELQKQEQDLRRGQDEHRLALLDFRQQLIDWQTQIAGLKRQMSRGETKLERRQAEMDDQLSELDVAAQKLAQRAEAIDEQHRFVVAERSEVDRHLLDLRAWYRVKLRELAGIPIDVAAAEPETPQAVEDSSVPTEQQQASADAEAIVPTQRNILSITEPLDPGDQQLGATLRGLQLIDGETLTVLLMESRRQRRSLRQVLLASGVVTLYQLALIEAGKVEDLVLGPVRVIDRVRANAHEAVYRVFDPRRGQEAVLRHLAEEEMNDAVHPDEFRQRFTQAMLADPHVAATYEVLDLANRPAVLQEWLTGLPATDWPPLAAAPGVCYRLLTQAALGLSAAHQAGLVHGHLDDGMILLTGDGIVKICGLGEPSWLVGKSAGVGQPTDDLRALGRIAAAWCLPNGVRKGAKTKPLPEELLTILHRLTSETDPGYTNAAALLEDLDRAGGDIPPNAEAWDRLLKYVREHETPEALLRQTA